MQDSFSVFFYNEDTCKRWRGVPVANIAHWNNENDFIGYLKMIGGYNFLDEAFKHNKTVRVKLEDSYITYTTLKCNVLSEQDFKKKEYEADIISANTINYLTTKCHRS